MLASPAVRQRIAPFSPARLRLFDSPTRVGLKGAGGSPNPDDASTTANVVSEERSESRESSRRGLSRCSQSNRTNLNSTLSPGTTQI
ncbi:hypothetical protein EWF95_11590 [Halonotius roseus]|uniref:Uncharacterized protein n=1 Tax=Halonotius roseus TaxID=2511997 RepID=A0A544QM15_9EURY|nr:hypothetical protein EWF95_11590 [Halonotius roseus]